MSSASIRRAAPGGSTRPTRSSSAASAASSSTSMARRTAGPLSASWSGPTSSSRASARAPPTAGGGGFPGSPPPQLGRYRCADGRWLELCLFQDRHLEWFARAFMPQEWIDEGMGDAQVLLFDEELKERARVRFAELLATRP